MMTSTEVMREYERRTNTHSFATVAPLIAGDAVYWFGDGSFVGIDAIAQAFERTWATIREERYVIEDVQWLVNDERAAVCVYHYRWQGIVAGEVKQGMGRGTSVLRPVDGVWKVVHEHLSRLPA